MKEYPDNVTWFDVLILCLRLIAAVISVTGLVYYFTNITPKREAALKAEGAAEADRKADAAGGWSKWIAREIGVDASCSTVAIVNGQDARCPSVASADGQDARRPSREVR